jgi:hypothetical protein
LESQGKLDGYPNIFKNNTETTMRLLIGAKSSTGNDSSSIKGNDSLRGLKMTFGERQKSKDSRNKDSQVTARFNRSKEPPTRLSLNI